MTPPSPLPRKGAVGGIAMLLLGTAVFVAVYLAVHALSAMTESLADPQTLRARAAYRIAGSVVLAWAYLVGIWGVLRLRGQSLADLGWGRPAPVRGWLAAVALTVLYTGMLLMGPLARMPLLSDWSAFRIITALSIAVSAGICEEVLFRGFVMTQAKNAGMPTSVQILLSAALFGLAHVGWSSLSGQFNLMAFIGSVGSTTIFGALLALVYVMSRRSLVPVIAAHAAIDLVIEPWLILYALGGGFAH